MNIKLKFFLKNIVIKLFWIVSLFAISFVTVFSFFFNWNNYYEYITNVQEQRLIIDVVESSVQIISNREYQILTTDIDDQVYPFGYKPNESEMKRWLDDSIAKLDVIKIDLQKIVTRPTSQNLK